MHKNSKWLYLNTKQDFFERWPYRIHLVGIEDISKDRDKLLFSIAKHLWYNNFKEQWLHILRESVLLDTPLFTLYHKEDYDQTSKISDTWSWQS